LAVVAANETQGMWWYSLNGGGEWWRLGSVSPASIRLLPASAMLVFRPDRNFVGEIKQALLVRAWDHTRGVAGSMARPQDVASSLSTATVPVAIDVATNSSASLIEILPGTPLWRIAPAGDLTIRNLTSSTATIQSVAHGAHLTTLGHGGVVVHSAKGSLTLGRGGTGKVTILGLLPGHTLTLETSFGPVVFDHSGRILSDLAPSRLLSIRRALKVYQVSGGAVFEISSTI
jgi:hypothetical protein